VFLIVALALASLGTSAAVILARIELLPASAVVSVQRISDDACASCPRSIRVICRSRSAVVVRGGLADCALLRPGGEPERPRVPNSDVVGVESGSLNPWISAVTSSAAIPFPPSPDRHNRLRSAIAREASRSTSLTRVRSSRRTPGFTPGRKGGSSMADDRADTRRVRSGTIRNVDLASRGRSRARSGSRPHDR
jgi:hypothetical protein